ncbi:hypothetical protein [Pseudorhizobium flavum]|uniref:hypothetical protein n=1 Tax=Pseudorhizobium flavum TaxID=1335061 RepID=UPI00376F92C1
MPNFYAYHMNLSGKNQVDKLLAENQIAIGWSRARGLLNTTLTEEAFNAELDAVYDFSTDRERNRARKECWQFLREMNVGDIVAVKKNNFFHFVRVEGRPRHHEVDDDTAIRRQIVKLRDDSIHLDNLPEPLRSNLQFRPMSVVRSFLLNDVLAFLGIDPEDAVDQAEALEADRLLMEATGSYVIPPKDELIIDRKHADVSAALYKHLDGKGLR